MLDPSLIQQLMSKFGLATLNPIQMFSLFQLKDKTPAELTVKDLKSLTTILHLDVSDDKLQAFTVGLNNDHTDGNLLDWITDNVNQDKLLALIPKQDEEPFISQCPECLGVQVLDDEAVKEAQEAEDNIFSVSCPHCSFIHVVPENLYLSKES